MQWWGKYGSAFMLERTRKHDLEGKLQIHLVGAWRTYQVTLSRDCCWQFICNSRAVNFFWPLYIKHRVLQVTLIVSKGSGTITLKKCPSIYLSQSGIGTYPDTYLQCSKKESLTARKVQNIFSLLTGEKKKYLTIIMPGEAILELL